MKIPDLMASRRLRDIETSITQSYVAFLLSRYRNEVPAGTRASYEFTVGAGLEFDDARNRAALLISWLHRPGGGFARRMRLLENRPKRMLRFVAEEKEPVRDEMEAEIVVENPDEGADVPNNVRCDDPKNGTPT